MSSKRIEPTRLLYHEDSYAKEFRARILSIQKFDGQHKIILDQTAFYSAGGGQPSDTGAIKGAKGEATVKEARMENGQVIHVLEGISGILEEGESVTGILDWSRRFALMRNHTLAHMMAEAVRRVVGLPTPVVSSGLDVDKARLDMAYDASLGPLLSQIEKVANDVVEENRPVEVRMMSRVEAERFVERFHESLKALPLQVQNVRIIEIRDWHACACGGTHVRSTGEIGAVQVLRRMSKGKGVERIEFAAKAS